MSRPRLLNTPACSHSALRSGVLTRRRLAGKVVGLNERQRSARRADEAMQGLGRRDRRLSGEPQLAALERSIDRRFREFYAQKPVSDEVFAQYLRLLRRATYLDNRVALEVHTDPLRERPTKAACPRRITSRTESRIAPDTCRLSSSR